MHTADSCPCGSRRHYADCCRPAHLGEEPSPTAERLMRSRYSANVLGSAAYLLASWHPSTRPPRIDLDDDVRWRRLQIVDTAAGGEGDVEGLVEFRASYRSAAGAGLVHERSRFLREGGRWLYVDGEILSGGD
ncbi:MULTISPECIES: YchJ family protein [unclassified Rathayibacter]|uniref:YchJ family protein n=1 Tax=unclassified Rathayibacter TaxID=2609250 RepID=UPI00188B02F5|nr:MULTISPECIES: YchJ family metal-binding protein [unclassified Rathayibacter]MBF4462569.1 SEC-C domain-containing protein [Rathayibacter sp. VKM Ac-2879]MBF4503388.1 SEC-C domain-containing protein [Rathayibacter sp. VKM Ac-2878]